MAQLSLQQLEQFNNELLGLFRAGLPLEPTLRRISKNGPHELRLLTQQLHDRVAKGESLPAALETLSTKLPAYYTVALEAAERSGNPGEIVESLAKSVSRQRAINETIRASLWYPQLLAAAAYVSGIFVAKTMTPSMLGFYDDSGKPVPWFLATLANLVSTPRGWAILVAAPFVAIALRQTLATWILNRCSGGAIQPSCRTGLRGMGLQAGFADVVALLLKVGAPLPRAMRLAARQSGDAAFISNVENGAAAIERGEPLNPKEMHALAPAIAYQLAAGSEQLPERLARCAIAFHRFADAHAARLQLWLPPCLLTLFGASVVILYGATFIWPWSQLLYSISAPR